MNAESLSIETLGEDAAPLDIEIAEPLSIEELSAAEPLSIESLSESAEPLDIELAEPLNIEELSAAEPLTIEPAGEEVGIKMVDIELADAVEVEDLGLAGDISSTRTSAHAKEGAKKATGVQIIFMDSGEAYDPLSRTAPVKGRTLETSSTGGFGIFIVKNTMSKVEYKRTDAHNMLTMVRYFE